MKRISQVVVATLAMVMALGFATAAGAHATSIKSRTLQLSDMPTGWSVDNSSSGGVNNAKGCLSALHSAPKTKGLADAKVYYAENQSIPALEEAVATGKSATTNKAYAKLVHTLNSCNKVSFTANDGTVVSGSIGAMSFPSVADASKAYNLALSAKGITLGADIIVFRQGNYDGELLFLDLGQPNETQLQQFVKAAVDRVEGKTPPPPNTESSGTTGTS
jgi:hypothetical protein